MSDKPRYALATGPLLFAAAAAVLLLFSRGMIHKSLVGELVATPLVILAAALVLADAAARKNLVLPPRFPVGLVLLWIFWNLLLLVVMPQTWKTPHAFFYYVSGPLAAFAAAVAAKNLEWIIAWLKIYAALFTVACIFGLFEWSPLWPRNSATFGNPNFWGGVAAGSVPVFIGLFMASRCALDRAVALVAGTLGVFNVIGIQTVIAVPEIIRDVYSGLTLVPETQAKIEPREISLYGCGSLGARLAFIAALAVGFWFFVVARKLPNFDPAARRIRRGVYVVTILALLAGYVTYASVERRSERPGAFTVRETFYTATYNMISDRPLTGHGPGSFGTKFPLYRPPDFRQRGLTANTQHAHNEPFEIGAETGMLGLLIVLLILRHLLFNGFLDRDRQKIGADFWLSAGLYTGALAMFLDALVSPTPRFGGTHFLMWIMLGIGLAIDDLGASQRRKSPPPALVGLAAAAFFALAGWCVFASLQRYEFEKHRSDADRALAKLESLYLDYRQEPELSRVPGFAETWNRYLGIVERSGARMRELLPRHPDGYYLPAQAAFKNTELDKSLGLLEGLFPLAPAYQDAQKLAGLVRRQLAERTSTPADERRLRYEVLAAFSEHLKFDSSCEAVILCAGALLDLIGAKERIGLAPRESEELQSQLCRILDDEAAKVTFELREHNFELYERLERMMALATRLSDPRDVRRRYAALADERPDRPLFATMAALGCLMENDLPAARRYLIASCKRAHKMTFTQRMIGKEIGTPDASKEDTVSSPN